LGVVFYILGNFDKLKGLDFWGIKAELRQVKEMNDDLKEIFRFILREQLDRQTPYTNNQRFDKLNNNYRVSKKYYILDDQYIYDLIESYKSILKSIVTSIAGHRIKVDNNYDKKSTYWRNQVDNINTFDAAKFKKFVELECNTYSDTNVLSDVQLCYLIVSKVTKINQKL
jgi:hypothetical protein